MRTTYSSFWIYLIIAAFSHANCSFAPVTPVDAYGNVITGAAPIGYATGYPTTSSAYGMGTPMGTATADEMALDRDAQSLENQLRMAQGGGMGATGAYPGAQGSYPPTAPGYATTSPAYGTTTYGSGASYGATQTGIMLPTTQPPLFPGGSGPMATRKTFGSTSARTTYDLCTQAIDQKSLLKSTDAVFNDFCLKLESAFTYCNFSEVSQANSEITPASLATIAAKAAVVIVKSITDGIDSIQKNIMDIVVSETEAVKKTSSQSRWKSAGWMLAAAANNRSFRASLATDSSETNKDNPATDFWKAFGKVFSIQPVSRRVEMPTPRGTMQWKEVQEEQATISDLFKAARRLNSARNTGKISTTEATDFVLGTRAFSKILTQSSFANGSIGLQQFAFRIFKEGIYNWLKDRSGAASLRHEFWIVAAEAFNLMYSAEIDQSYIFPRNINIGGNHFASDHIMFRQENGSMSYNLKNTYLTDYEKSLKEIADTFTTHFSKIGLFKGPFESVKPVDLIAQNDSDLSVLMLCSEACEYSMNISQAPNTAKLITYFYGKGFSFNNKVVDWNVLTSGSACLTILTLNRLLQRTTTSILGSAAGDYNSVQLYQALQEAYATINVACDRFPAVQKALAPMLPQLQEDKTKLQKYMSSKSSLKRLTTPDIILTTAEQNGVRPISRPITPPGYGSAGYGYAGQQYAPGYAASGYPAAYPQQQIVYGAQPQMRTVVPMTTYNMGAIPQATQYRTGYAPTQARYPTGYGAPAQQRYMAPGVRGY